MSFAPAFLCCPRGGGPWRGAESGGRAAVERGSRECVRCLLPGCGAGGRPRPTRACCSLAATGLLPWEDLGCLRKEAVSDPRLVRQGAGLGAEIRFVLPVGVAEARPAASSQRVTQGYRDGAPAALPVAGAFCKQLGLVMTHPHTEDYFLVDGFLRSFEFHSFFPYATLPAPFGMTWQRLWFGVWITRLRGGILAMVGVSLIT